MATNQARWVGSLYGTPEPLLCLGRFVAGATTAIKQGEFLELTGSTNVTWVPLDSDFDMSAAAGSGGKIAIAHEEIKSGDLAGFYNMVVPRTGDLFEFDLAAAGASLAGTAVYYSDSETVTITAGTNVIGHKAGFENYPLPQGHAADDASPTRGVTVRSVSKIVMTVETSNSYYSALQGT